MPRRSSYASVAAGTAAGAGHHPGSQAHARTSSLSTRAELNASPYNPQLSADHPSRNTQTYEGSESRGNEFEGITSALGKGGGRSSLSGHHYYGQGHGLTGNADPNAFFTPTYLRGSRYIERLEAAHKEKLAAQREAHPSHSVAPGSLSSSSSSVSLYKMAPSHRGMTYEIIEHQPHVDDEGVMPPLPAKWGEANKGGLEISGDGLDVKFIGPTKLGDHEGATTRADHPMPPQCGIYFFEVTIVSKGKEE